MKLLLFVLLLLFSCEKQSTTMPQEKVESTEFKLNDSSQTILSFNDTQTRDSLFNLLKEHNFKYLIKDSLGTKIYSISYLRSTLDSVNKIDFNDSFVEVDLDTTFWENGATVSLTTPLPLTAFNFINYVSIDTTIKVSEFENSSYTLKSRYTTTSLFVELNQLLRDDPIEANLLLGNIKDIANYFAGVSPTVLGMAAISPSELKILSYNPPNPKIFNVLVPQRENGIYYKDTMVKGNKVHYLIAKNIPAIPHLDTVKITEKLQSDPIIELSTTNSMGTILFRKSNIRVVKNRLSNFSITTFDTLNIALHWAYTIDENIYSIITKNIESSSSKLPFNTTITSNAVVENNTFSTSIIGTIDTTKILVNKDNPIFYATAISINKILNNNEIPSKIIALNTENYLKAIGNKAYTFTIYSTIEKENTLFSVPLYIVLKSPYKLEANNFYKSKEVENEF